MRRRHPRTAVSGLYIELCVIRRGLYVTSGALQTVQRPRGAVRAGIRVYVILREDICYAQVAYRLGDIALLLCPDKLQGV